MSPTRRLTVKYAEKKLELGETGSDYSSFLAQLAEDNRIYGYVRFMMSDGSYKYAFIIWIGPAVNSLEKASVSNDKAFVKSILEVSYATWILHMKLSCLFHPSRILTRKSLQMRNLRWLKIKSGNCLKKIFFNGIETGILRDNITVLLNSLKGKC